MLRLAVSEEGNVVLSEGGHTATCDVRKKAMAQAILRPELVEGMAFVMAVWGTGVIKIRPFSSMAQARKWFISGLHFPPGSIRMRTQKTNYVAVSVFSDRLVCTPIDQLQPTFIIKTTSSNSTLAFDVESGHVGINVGQLTYYGTPVLDNQLNLFEDHSPYLQTEDSNTGTSIQPLHPNPLSMCDVPDLILSPGVVLKLSVTGTMQVKDTGAYIRLWLLSRDQENMDFTPGHQSGKFLRLERSSTEEWYLHVEANEILVLNRFGNLVVDSITVATDIAKMNLAFELYKASVSVMKTGGTQSYEASTPVPKPFQSAPIPHHKKIRESISRANVLQGGSSNVKTRVGSSPNHYLTPKAVVYNPAGNDQDDQENDLGGRIINADHQTSLSSQESGQRKTWTNRSPDRLPRTSETGPKATSKHLKLDVSMSPVEEPDYEDTSITELKRVAGNDAHPMKTAGYYPDGKPVAKIVGHHRRPTVSESRRRGDAFEVTAGPGNVQSAASVLQPGNAFMRDAIELEEDYVDTEQVASCPQRVVSPTVGNHGDRLSSFQMHDAFHETDRKTI